MATEQKSVVYEYEEINREIIVLFKDTPIIKDESVFKRSHYFKNAENASITTMSENIIKLKLRKALRDLNYLYTHIQIVLYDELLDNLEKFLNQMDIEMNI